MPVGQVPGLGGLRGMKTRARLQGRFLIHRQHALVITHWPCVKVDQLGDGGIKSEIPWALGIQPEMMMPRFELMAGQNPPHRGGGDGLNDPLRDELARQFGAIPLGEAAAQSLGSLAGEAHHVDGHLGGENHPWPHGQGRQPGHPGAGRETAGPTSGPRSVARRPPAPRQTGSARRPATGESSPGAPGLQRWWSTVATVPRSAALRSIRQCAMKTCGRVPSPSPPRNVDGTGEEIVVRFLIVKQIWIPFHDELYLARSWMGYLAVTSIALTLALSTTDWKVMLSTPSVTVTGTATS